MATPPESPSVGLMREAFDPDFYLREYPDVAIAGVDPFEHFLGWGWRERRDPAPWFRTAAYLDVNPDVELAGMNPFEHYVVTGKREGRPLEHDLGFRYDVLKAAVSLEDRVCLARETSALAPLSPITELARSLDAVAGLDRLHVSISHDDFRTSVGGIQHCLALETRAMAARGRPWLHLYPPVSLPTLDFESLAPRIGVLLNGRRLGVFDASDLREAVDGRIVAASFAVHSFLGHDVPAVTAVLRAMRPRAGFFWVHDFSSVCSNYALLRNDVVFCGMPPPDSRACEICHYGERRRIHLADHAAFFRAFDLTVVAPSETALSFWLRAYPGAARAIRILPHASLRSSGPAAIDGRGPLEVAFLGMPVTLKGWPTFTHLAKRFAEDPRYRFHHLGDAPDRRAPVIYRRVGAGESMAKTIEELGIDVAIVWSLCPETFCLAAYEALAAGAAVITCPDSGNVAQLVAADDRRGLVVDDEEMLHRLFSSGEAERLDRSARGAELHELVYSRLTADLLDEAAA